MWSMRKGEGGGQYCRSATITCVGVNVQAQEEGDFPPHRITLYII